MWFEEHHRSSQNFLHNIRASFRTSTATLPVWHAYKDVSCKTPWSDSVFVIVPGSLPPSPADSGVSDVDSSSSGHTSNDELKARLQPTPGQYTPRLVGR